MDSFVTIGVVGRVVVPEELSRVIRTDQLQYCLLPPLRHDAGRTVSRPTTDTTSAVAAISRPFTLPADLRQQLPRRCMQYLCHIVQDGVVCMYFDVPTTLERDEGPANLLFLVQ